MAPKAKAKTEKKSAPKKVPLPPRSPSKPSDESLALPALLKYLTSAAKKPLSMKQAMRAAAILVPKQLTSPAKLAQLTFVDMSELGIKDEDIRKGIAALSRDGSGGSKAYKRPNKDSDLDRPLPTSATVDAPDSEADYAFDEAHDEHALGMKTVVVNRAPVLTAWATVVAERLGFARRESLSIASVFTSLNASAAKGGSAPTLGEAQPFVDMMGRKVALFQSATGEWRAIHEGELAEPATAYKYINKSFAQQTGAVVSAMRLLAASFPSDELNKKAYGLYFDFRPDVEAWGAKAALKLKNILELRRNLTHKDEIKQEGEREENGEAVVKIEGGPGVVKLEEGATAEVATAAKEEPEDNFDALLDDDEGWDLSAVP